MNERFSVFFACDRAYAQLLLIAVKSLLKTFRDPGRLDLYLVDRGIPVHLRHVLESYVDEAGASLAVTCADRAGLEQIEGMPESFFELPETGHYDRLLAPFLVTSSRVLYADTDMLFQEDISHLWEEDLLGHPIAAVQDQIIPTVSDECGVIDWEKKGFERAVPYFNSGIMMMDLDEWRTSGLTDACIVSALEFITEFEGPPPLHDQYALNAVLYRNWKPLSEKWNFFAQKIKGVPEEIGIVHFAGSHKPFFQAKIPAGPIRYFSRIAQNLVKADIENARETAGSRECQNRRYEAQKAEDLSVKSTNGRAVTFAPSALLGAPPDGGPIAIVIPVSLVGSVPMRLRNFRFLVDRYRRKNIPVVVVEQDNGSGIVEQVVSEFDSKDLHHLTTKFHDGSFHKCALINQGAEFAFGKLGVRYVWQVDADIYVDPDAILNQLASLNSNVVPVIRPMVHFVRLDDTKSRRLIETGNSETVESELGASIVSPYDIVDLFGPGSVIFSETAFRTSGGMDEAYTGWGWEDMDFAERLAKTAVPHTLPLIGYHLYHEEDRKPVSGNFEKFADSHNVEKSEEELDRIRRHTTFHNYLGKFCVIGEKGTPWLEEFGTALNSMDWVDFRNRPYDPGIRPYGESRYSSLDERIVHAMTENTVHFAGFLWDPEVPLTTEGRGRPGLIESLVNLIVASNFRIVLVKPDTAGAQIRWRGVRSLLQNAVDAYVRNPSPLLEFDPHEPDFDNSMEIDRCRVHCRIPSVHSGGSVPPR